MRIIDNANTTIEFSALKVGDCFMYDNCLFIKICPVKENSPNACNAFCFVDNCVAFFRPDFTVTPVEAEIIIRNKGVRE
jgi:hypothetical protein